MASTAPVSNGAGVSNIDRTRRTGAGSPAAPSSGTASAPRARVALPDILTQVPGIGAILIGEGDLSQELGVPRQYEHPLVVEWMARVVSVCKEHGVPVGHPHVDLKNVERIVGEGYRFLMAAPVRSYAALEAGRKLAGR